MIVIENAHLRVEVSAAGAELQSVRTHAGSREWLWQGDAAWWSGRAPLLFPVVGLSPQGQVTIAGHPYSMGSHGFARHSRFRILAHTPDAVAFRLEPDDRILDSYPFEFAMTVIYRVDDDWLRCHVTVANNDENDMPFQFGFHPAFVWPLPGADGQIHQVTLQDDRTPPMLRPDQAGLIDETVHPSAFVRGALALSPDLFAAGAMVFPENVGTFFAYGTSAASVEMVTANLPNFALWQKPGAPFICLEPWAGTAPFPRQGPALEHRNGRTILSSGERANFSMDLRFVSRVDA